MALDLDKTQKPVRKLRKLLKNISGVPAPEDVHVLRTNARRLESTVKAMSLDSHPNERRLLKQVARLRKRGGKVRDMDVLIAHASMVHPTGENDCSVRLLERLGSKREAAGKKLYAAIRGHDEELRSRLKRTSERMQQAIERRGSQQNQGEVVSSEVAVAALRLSSELGVPKRLSRTTLHPYRLKVKELKNLLEMSNEANQNLLITELGEVKDAIGEWHDWQELVGIAASTLDHGAACKLSNELKKIGGERYRQAIRLTDKFRKKYSLVTDLKSGKASPHNGKEPVLSAVGNLAA